MLEAFTYVARVCVCNRAVRGTPCNHRLGSSKELTQHPVHILSTCGPLQHFEESQNEAVESREPSEGKTGDFSLRPLSSLRPSAVLRFPTSSFALRTTAGEEVVIVKGGGSRSDDSRESYHRHHCIACVLLQSPSVTPLSLFKCSTHCPPVLPTPPPASSRRAMSQWNEGSGGGDDGDDFTPIPNPSNSFGLQGTSAFPPSTPPNPLLFPRIPPRAGGPSPRQALSYSLGSPSLTATSSESADFDRFTDLLDPSTSSASSPSPSSLDRGVVQFDFRHGTLPPGVTICGEAELQVQADKSTALVLSPSAYLRLSLPFTPNGAIKATRVNDYSLTMDVKSQSPASFGGEGVALYQTKWDVNTATGSEGEAYISKGGGVGTFGEYGQATAWAKPGKWHRVVLTMGGQWNNRRFASYINAKACANLNKGVFNTMDGRFSLTPDSVTLFASTKAALMPGLLVRFIEVRSSTMSKEQVMEQVNANRVYSYWEKEEEEAKTARYASLSLTSLYKKPPPFWIHPAFLGQMGDAFLEGTGLDSGDVAPSIAVLSLIYSHLRHQSEAVEGLIQDEDWAVVDFVSEVLKEAKELSRRFTLARKNPAQLIAFMKFFRQKLEAVKEGDTIIVSAGIDSHPVMLTVERVATATYRLTITNSHPLAGLQYHLVSAATAPKLKYRTSLVFDGIPAGKLMDDAWWVLVFKLIVMPSKMNRPDKSASSHPTPQRHTAYSNLARNGC